MGRRAGLDPAAFESVRIESNGLYYTACVGPRDETVRYSIGPKSKWTRDRALVAAGFLFARYKGAAPVMVNDGPVAPSSLQVNGAAAPVSPRVFRALRALWRVKSLTLTEFAQQVWDEEPEATQGAVKVVLNRLNTVFFERGLRWRASISSGTIHVHRPADAARRNRL